jgi:SulP family sulfate permease
MIPRNRRADILAGLTVAAILVPQALAYAELAGMPPERGLLASVLPPIAAALFACSPYLQTGPVALTSLLTYTALAGLAPVGSDEYVRLGIILPLLVGIARLVLGLLRAGRIAYLMSEPVLVGFVQAGAVLIVLSQLPTLVGLPRGAGNVVTDSLSSIGHPATWSTECLALAVAAAVAMLVGRRVSTTFPFVLTTLIVATIYSARSDFQGPTVGVIKPGFPELGAIVPDLHDIPSLVGPAAVIAVVGFAEPASIARTFATQDRKPWDANRELVSQGIANLASAASAAFPVGGSFSRSALARQAGARTQLTSVVAGIAVLMFLPFAALLEPLPLAVLASVVVLAAASLFSPLALVRLTRLSTVQGGVAICTFATTLLFSPHVEYGVLVGIGLSIGVHLFKELRVDIDVLVNGDRLVFRPRGALWFASAREVEAAFTAALAASPAVRRVEINMRGIGRMDVTGALAIQRMLDDGRSAALEIQITDLPPSANRWRSALFVAKPER